MAEEEELVILESDDTQNEEEIDDLEQIIELEPDDTQEDAVSEELKKLESQEVLETPESRKKKFIFIGIGVFLFLLIVLVVTLFLIFGKDEQSKQITPQEIVENIQKKENIARFSPSKVENMLKRANTLYAKGKKVEALNIYKHIANFNESLSNYNMGVAQMKEGDYEVAIESFRKAILNQENRTVSAINAAVCALYLKEQKLFENYLDLAYTYLPEESTSPLYSYYIGLINFYRGNYFEALSSLAHPGSKHYADRQAYVASKIYTFLDRPYSALEALQVFRNSNDILSEGLLYASIGEYKIAKEKLAKALINLNKPKRAKLALALVDMKLGNFQDASSALRESFIQDENLTKSTYPIKATLNPAFFDINRAQKNFVDSLFYSKSQQYAMLFYFAPYKVFDAKQTMKIIRKGGINTFLDDTGLAKEYLSASSTISKVNAMMSEAIKLALEHRILKANKEFKGMLEIYSKHSILHYNLALTYAQLGNYTLAHKHFSSSYHLDPKNYLSGLFSAICSELISKDNKKLLEDIKSTMNNDNSLKPVNFYAALAHLIENNQFSMNRWLEEDENKKSPLHLIFDIITAKLVNKEGEYLSHIKILQELLPQDILANIISFHAQNEHRNIKEYAEQLQIDFFKRDLDMSGFYYGSKIAKEQYVKFLQLSGLIYKERERLEKRFKVEQQDVVGVMHALAYLDIFTNHFEEAYTLYNSLIDDHKQQDTNTIFLGATASIGAGHHENAIALLELSKLIDANNLESRYALGLLYQEISNYEGAATQYNMIGNSGFKSKYFDFKITKE